MSKIFGFLCAVHTNVDGSFETGWVDPTWSMTEFCGNKDSSLIFEGYPTDIWFHQSIQGILQGYSQSEESPNEWDRYEESEWFYTIILQEKVPDSQRGWIMREWTYEKPKHMDYPHYNGTLYDCHGCETQCYCGEVGVCVFCSINSID